MLTVLQNNQTGDAGNPSPSSTSLFRYQVMLPDALPLELLTPAALPCGRSIFVASSSLGHDLDRLDLLFDALRTLVARLDAEKAFLITAAGTTMDVFVRRAAELFGISVVVFQTWPRKRQSLRSSQRTPIPSNWAAANSQALPCLYRSTSTKPERASAKSEFPPVNDLLILLATEVHCLSVRKEGRVHQAVKKRLNAQKETVKNFNSHDELPTTRVLMDGSLTPKSVQDELIRDGAVAWYLYDEAIETNGDQACVSGPARQPPPAKPSSVPILRLNQIPVDQFLLHWTRRRTGPWPDQSDDEYLDDLIFQQHRRHHSEVDALARILSTRRVLASNRLTRDSRPVVCFSNVPLDQIHLHRVFRAHLGRWDFLPCGIAIKRDLLQKLGARPVIYGDEITWNALSVDDRPYFQLAHSADRRIDWTKEQEWRLLSDLELNRLPIDAVIVFVPSEPDARKIMSLSRWPILVMSSEQD